MLFIRGERQGLPSSRRASTTKIQRPSSLTTDTHPLLQPDLLRQSAMISQYLAVSHGLNSDEFLLLQIYRKLPLD